MGTPLLFMDPVVIAALIQAVASIGATAFNYSSAKESREFSSEEGRYNRLVDMGVNPNVAMSSVLGNSSPIGSPAMANLDGLGEMLNGIIQQPAQKSNINLMDSEAEFNRANALYTQMKSFYVPLEFAQREKLVNAQVMDLHSNSLMNDALAGRIKQEALMVVPLASAELAKARSSIMNQIASAVAYLQQSELFSSEGAYYDSLKTGQDIQNSIDDKTKQDQVDIIVQISKLKSALARDAEWSTLWKDHTNGLGLSGDFVQDLAIMKSIPAYAPLADTILDKFTYLSNEIQTREVQEANRHWGSYFLQNLTSIGNDVVGGFASGAGMGLGMTAFGSGGRVARSVSGKVAKASAVSPVSGAPKGFKGRTRVLNGQKQKSFWSDKAGREVWYNVYD